MDSLVFMDSEQAIALEDVLEIEKTYSVSLSDDYKELIVRFNGGRPNRTLYEGAGESLVLSDLLPIKYGVYTLEKAIIQWKINEQLLPLPIVPFAFDPADNLVCLSQASEDYGSVYVWAYDSVRPLRYVAGSLREVLEGLKEFEW